MTAVMRVFDLSLGQMLWSRRTMFMALLVGVPAALALIARGLAAGGFLWMRVQGVAVSGSEVFAVMVWLLFLRFIVPVLGMFYGTSLIADEVEDKTITYLFTRPIQRGAVLTGKYLAYVVCTTAMVLPAVVVAYFVAVPLSDVASSFGAMVTDLGILAIGLAVYGALFALVGVLLKKPLVVGLIFVFAWEQVVLLMPGSFKQFTVAYHLQALVPHAQPADETVSFLQSVFRDAPSPWASLFWLCAILVVCLGLAVTIIERREYVLDQ